LKFFLKKINETNKNNISGTSVHNLDTNAIIIANDAGMYIVPNSYLDQQIQGSKENSGLISTQSTYFCQELSFKSL